MKDRKLTLQVPSSKSQTQRAILVAALTRGQSILHRPLDCYDSRHLRACLSALGARFTESGDRLEIGGGELHSPLTPLDCGDGGTTLRFLLPLSLILDGPVVFDGSPRLRERPVTPLLDALRSLGATIEHLDRPGSIPVRITMSKASLPSAQAVASIETSETSQFASGLLLTAPRLPQGLTLRLSSTRVSVSAPYLEMTLETMRRRGVSVERAAETYFVPHAAYRPVELEVEGDWSSAAFLLVGARLAGIELELPNLDPHSTQGDRVITTQLDELSRCRPHTFDLTDCPDLVAPLAVAAALAPNPTKITGAAHARLKESDRLTSLSEGLRTVGVRARETPDGLEIEPGGEPRQGLVRTRRDHRMAMAFGLLSLVHPGIEVDDRECVSKSYPSFWEDLARISAHRAHVASGPIC
ncbi:MAG: 3-phosphoshikimate 1-carboxyvinyltransferase [Deltaproteobacteria bacterium]|nr:3-phosphoshikimate 1-carboxyvinyltransferase [Deltaproteobacteria bacterium]